MTTNVATRTGKMISKKTSLHVYHDFLYTILLSLHDYNGVVKGEMKFEPLRIHFFGDVFATIADSHFHKSFCAESKQFIYLSLHYFSC